MSRTYPTGLYLFALTSIEYFRNQEGAVMATEPLTKVPETENVGDGFLSEVVKEKGWGFKALLPSIIQIACMFGIVAGAAVLGYASLIHRSMSALHAGFLMVVIVLTGTSFVLFSRSLEAEKQLFIESHWGGLGGGLGGWRVSRSLTYLLVTVPLALLLWHSVQTYPLRTDAGYRLERYLPAIDEAQRQNVKQLTVRVSDDKLFLSGTAPNISAANSVWNLIKQANPTYDDIEVDFSIPK